MGAMSGTAGSVVYVDRTLGDQVVGAVREWSLDLGNAVVEVTAMGEGASRFVPNIRRATGSFVAHFDGADTAQGGLRDDGLAGEEVRLLLVGAGTVVVDALRAHVTGWNPSVSVDGRPVVEWSFGVTGRLDTNVGEGLLLLESGDLVLTEQWAGGIRTDAVNVW